MLKTKTVEGIGRIYQNTGQPRGGLVGRGSGILDGNKVITFSNRPLQLDVNMQPFIEVEGIKFVLKQKKEVNYLPSRRSRL